MLTNLGWWSMRLILETVVSSVNDETVFLHNLPYLSCPQLRWRLTRIPRSRGARAFWQLPGQRGRMLGRRYGRSYSEDVCVKLMLKFMCVPFLGDQHDQPIDRADALQICHWRGTHNWHGEYQGGQHTKYFRCLTLPSCFLLQIFAKMASGEEAKKQFSILDTGVKVDLPDHFCLERPEDGRVSSSKTLK